ncbi:MAG: hypothetical protein ACI4V1_03660 [Eubacteriales bacterium]
MKNFVARHGAGFLISAVLFFLIACSLGAYIYYDFCADTEMARTQEHLHETLLKTNVRRLGAALTEENRMTSYHFAMTAAENAASAGRGDDALFFRKISAGLADGADNMTEIAAAVEDYLTEGTVPEAFLFSYAAADVSDSSETEDEPASVSYYRKQAAMECAASIAGVQGVLWEAEKSRSGEFIFTCRNAYAVIDARSGTPLEAGISLKPGEIRLSETDCASSAAAFLKEYFPPDIARSAVLVSAVPDEAAGTYEFLYRSGGRDIRLAVKRDTGRVVRLVAR